MHLFTYGTLMFPKIWMRVVGRAYPSQRATLSGYAVYRAAGEVFPVMVRADKDHAVDGSVYFDLDDTAVALLDGYESDLYDRIEVEAALDDGRAVPCQTYVLPEKHRRLATGERWDAQWFEREAMADYMRRLEA